MKKPNAIDVSARQDHYHVEVDGVVIGIGNLGQVASCESNAAELREKPEIAAFLRNAERDAPCPWCLQLDGKNIGEVG